MQSTQPGSNTPQGHTGVSGLALLRRVGGYMVCSHVGVGRVYRLRDGRFEPMTVGHTLEFEEFGGNGPSPKWKNVLTRATRSNQAIVRATHRCWCMRAGDRVFACTPGVTERLTPSQLHNILQRRASPCHLTAELRDRLARIDGVFHSGFVVVDVLGPQATEPWDTRRD